MIELSFLTYEKYEALATVISHEWYCKEVDPDTYFVASLAGTK